MRTTILLVLLAGVSLTLLSGCVGTVDGRRQAGMPFSKDRVEGRYQRTPKELWMAARDVLNYLGTVTGEDSMRNVLQANVDARTVWVLVEEVDNSITRIVVQARTKGGRGDRELAGYIDKQIAVRLAAGPLSPVPKRRD